MLKNTMFVSVINYHSSKYFAWVGRDKKERRENCEGAK